MPMMILNWKESDLFQLQLRQQQPENKDESNPKEDLGHENVFRIFLGTHHWPVKVVKVKGRGEKSKRKSSNSKGHVESTISKAKAGEVLGVIVLWFRPLSRRSGREFVSRVLPC